MSPTASRTWLRRGPESCRLRVRSGSLACPETSANSRFERTGANGRGHLPCRRSWRVPSSAQNHAGNSGFSVDAESLARRARGGMVRLRSRLTSRRGPASHSDLRFWPRTSAARRTERGARSPCRQPKGVQVDSARKLAVILGCSTSSRSSRRSRRSVSTSQSWTTPWGYIAGDGQDNKSIWQRSWS